MIAKISVICPTRNEINHIESLFTNLLLLEPIDKEIIFIDGMSKDGTFEHLEKNARNHKNVKVFKNVDLTVPFALNIGIGVAVGDIIIRVDAHSDYAPDYLEKIIETFSKVKADIVGGPTRTRYKGSTQEAIAYIISNPIGFGGSSVHDEKFEGYTDSVTFGAWRKEMFDTIGEFDTKLKRNQDDELHYRAKSLGYKIYQNPAIKLWYYPRSTFASLFTQYYQYGRYKPRVLLKNPSELKIRHIIPSIFVLYILSLPLTVILFNLIVLIPLVFYFLLLIGLITSRGKRLFIKGKAVVAASIIHFSYGLGFIIGALTPTTYES